MTDAADITAARTIRIESVIANRGIKLKRSGTEHIGPCPICGGTDRFAYNTTKQCWNCRGCGGRGDVIALVQHLDGCDFATAVKTLLGNAPTNLAPRWPQVHQTPKTSTSQDDEQRRLNFADRLWCAAVPITGTPGAAYLQKRGINLAQVPSAGGLRWLLHCRWEGATAPCIISRFTDALTGAPSGIHRRPVDGDKPKSLGPLAGCVVRLWPDHEVSTGLVIGEGIETVLAAATRCTHRGTRLQPAWACGSATNLAKFPVLSGIEALTILVDHDDTGAGERAANECAQRWRDAGHEVTLLMPRDFGDFNDLVQR